MPGSFTVVHTNTQDEFLCEFECPQIDLVSPTRLRDPPKNPALHFFVTPEVPITELGTSNTFSKFIDLLTDLGSPMPPSSALFLPINGAKEK